MSKLLPSDIVKIFSKSIGLGKNCRAAIGYGLAIEHGELTLGREFRAKAGGLGVWRITGKTENCGETRYRLTNEALGIERKATAEMIREHLK